ncbi:MAG TPA: glycogen/starch/alpha-glucan phosphorylase [Beijerinckiaceae bacterium]
MTESHRSARAAVAAVGPALDSEAASFRQAVQDKLLHALGRDPRRVTDRDWFAATALSVRDEVVDRWRESERRVERAGGKQVAYLSLEFLIGRLMADSLHNLGLTAAAEAALDDLGTSLPAVRAAEPDAALGNGGLGRLAACFMESLASLSIPAFGYGIRYDHGLFRQVIADGWQQEEPDSWLKGGNPWEFERPETVYPIKFGGSVELAGAPDGTVHHIWHAAETVEARAYDILVPGWRGRHVNTLRLWAARAVAPLSLDRFNAGDHVAAQEAQSRAEAISRVLYPSDATPAGHELRLRQEFFFTSASLQDLIARHLERHGDVATLNQHAAVQLNDTHPAIAIAELMRLLVDEHGLPWERAWPIATTTLSYTNHTLLPEALETWPVSLMERVLPRHMQIIYLINWLHLETLASEGRLTDENLDKVSLIDERHGRRVRMGHLAFLGAHKVNGVSALHTGLMRETVFKDLHALYPDRIENKTNGITVRRWLHQANPALTQLVREAVGERVLDDIGAITALEPLAEDRGFRERFAAARRTNKEALAAVIRDRLGFAVDPAALFDVQVKRIHEYKRQLLNVIETVALYQAIRRDPDRDWTPRVKVFAGKAAASYATAKLVIKLANDVARTVNADPLVGDRLKVAYLPNYNVSLAEVIIPAADLSEQISTAGMEASGTGNMKFALNGALTIGTLDGANVEMRDHVGAENIVIFGLTADEVARLWRDGYDPRATLQADPRLALALDAIARGAFSPDAPDRYRALVDGLLGQDRYLVTADFNAYWTAQRGLDELFVRPDAWWRMSVLNTARMAWFSSDRTIADYAKNIWRASPVA